MNESLFETMAEAVRPMHTKPMTHIKISIDGNGKGTISYAGEHSYSQFLTVDQSARIMEAIYNEVSK